MKKDHIITETPQLNDKIILKYKALLSAIFHSKTRRIMSDRKVTNQKSKVTIHKSQNKRAGLCFNKRKRLRPNKK
jgi:hypothetical protein